MAVFHCRPHDSTITIAPCLYPWCRAQQFCRLQHTTADSGPNRVSNTFACSLFSVSDVDDCKFITRLNGAVVRHLSDSTCDGMPRGWIQDGFSSKPLTCKMIHCDIHSMERQKKNPFLLYVLPAFVGNS